MTLKLSIIYQQVLSSGVLAARLLLPKQHDIPFDPWLPTTTFPPTLHHAEAKYRGDTRTFIVIHIHF